MLKSLNPGKNLTRLLLLFCLFHLIGCVATPNYYTGKTLRDGERVLTGGIDNVYIARGDNLKEKLNKSPFTISFGYAQGLPSRFEAGFRYIPLNITEGILRWEATPDPFNYFDLSINTHLIFFIPYFSYSKYGLTLSKEIGSFEPFINYYRYFYLLGKERGSSTIKTDFMKFRTIGIGFAIPIPRAELIPEINYQYNSNDFSRGILFFNVGLRSKIE